jgi:hypothetical protein
MADDKKKLKKKQQLKKIRAKVNYSIRLLNLNLLVPFLNFIK